jgi:hypothetical protein
MKKGRAVHYLMSSIAAIPKQPSLYGEDISRSFHIHFSIRWRGWRDGILRQHFRVCASARAYTACAFSRLCAAFAALVQAAAEHGRQRVAYLAVGSTVPARASSLALPRRLLS